MSQKTMFYLAAFIGSIIGGYIPTLFGVGFLSITSLVFSTIGAILAIVAVWKFFNY